jgi:hypothetical protein
VPRGGRPTETIVRPEGLPVHPEGIVSMPGVLSASELPTNAPCRTDVGFNPLDTASVMLTPALRRWPWWLAEALVSLVAFGAAYWPLRHRPEGWSLALTAMATVGYAALTVEIMSLNRRQVHTLSEQLVLQREDFQHQKTALSDQLALQHEELKHQKAALSDQRQQAEAQLKQTEEARDAARRTFLESVYARYDASAPQVSVAIQGSLIFRQVQRSDGSRLPADPVFIEQDELEAFDIRYAVPIEFCNFGGTAVLVTTESLTSGQLIRQKGLPLPRVWKLDPISDAEPVIINWEYSGTADHILHVLGQRPPFGVKCVFEVRDLFGNVVDTHTLEFMFTAVERDGSRVRLPNMPVEIIKKDKDLHETGGVARVSRKYREP